MSHFSAYRDVAALLQGVQDGEVTPASVLETCAAASQGEANRHVYMQDPAPGLLEAARQSHLPAQGAYGSTKPLAGIPVSIKDLFDVEGQITMAGSKALEGAAAALQDCPAVARLKAAGAVLAGRTNMVEFAFSGVGINPHYGTPVNPADTAVARIPGGSSSGAAVSVATGAAWMALGSDTGGSIRIPAALCGLVGFKSTARLVPADGAWPLSSSLDTVCAITRSVRDAITAHEVLAARTVRRPARPLSQRRLAIARHTMQDGLDAGVARAFEIALQVLAATGAQIEEIALDEIGELAAINATGGLSAAESYAWHRKLIAEKQALYDPRVALRILRGAAMSAADYIDLLANRRRWIARMQARLHGFHAVLSPTVPLVAPPIATLAGNDEEFFRVNGLLLRNTSVVNMLDGCAISIPCHGAGALPVGLMIWHGALHDDDVLDIALQAESALAPSRSH
ncbi:MAG: amidase [Polaromonas sp.]|nr:amidase [Polaromonas sp.]